jgi:RimJ/RimL family protein N-acetyltransferase
MKIFDTMKLEKVSNEDVDFLYKMLGERDESVNITHKKMPSYEMHKKFVLETNPYDGWYIIMLESKKTGNIWIEDNNDIGWFIKKEFQNLGIPIKAFEILKKLHKRDFYIGKNNLKNIRACRLLEKMGFTLKNTSVNDEMITYELIKSRN